MEPLAIVEAVLCQFSDVTGGLWRFVVVEVDEDVPPSGNDKLHDHFAGLDDIVLTARRAGASEDNQTKARNK